MPHLLRPANYPRVVAQHPEGGRDQEDSDVGVDKKTSIFIDRSVREITRRMDDGVESTEINADVEVLDTNQITRTKRDSYTIKNTNSVDEEEDDDTVEEKGEEEYQEEEEDDQDEDEEEDDEDEDDEEEEELGEEEEAIVETVLEKLYAMVATEAEAVVAELADGIELEELEKGLIKSLEGVMVDDVKERMQGLIEVTEAVIETLALAAAEAFAVAEVTKTAAEAVLAAAAVKEAETAEEAAQATKEPASEAVEAAAKASIAKAAAAIAEAEAAEEVKQAAAALRAAEADANQQYDDDDDDKDEEMMMEIHNHVNIRETEDRKRFAGSNEVMNREYCHYSNEQRVLE